MMERAGVETIDGLRLEHAPPAGPRKPVPLLLVHGAWGGSWYLRNYLYTAALAGWDSWAVNLRGHAGSRPVADLGRVSVLDYVQDVRDCLQALGDCVVIGHSMGGLIAQKVAEGGGVRAAVFLTSAGPRGVVVLRWPVLSRLARYVPALARGRAFEMSFQHAAALELNRLPAADQARVYGQLQPESGRAMREIALGAIAVAPGSLRLPTLVVGAEDDRITPPGVQRRIAARYGSEYIEAAGHAHMLMLEPGWEGPFARILDWMDRALTPPADG
ncbi:MAG TPA: alpha/beta fold hydrolase [Candidatus Binatia bacterium]|nr:alpha/beta fold hydrolase [Candidatus Binatia bacterium]